MTLLVDEPYVALDLPVDADTCDHLNDVLMLHVYVCVLYMLLCGDELRILSFKLC